MPCLVNAIDIFVDFSTWQAMGMTAMEAMATGCAVVVTRNGGPGIFARHEENCLLVDPHDQADCLAALDRLVKDDALRRRLGFVELRRRQIQRRKTICIMPLHATVLVLKKVPYLLCKATVFGHFLC